MTESSGEFDFGTGNDEHGGLARVELVGHVEQRELEAPLRPRLWVGVAAHADHVRGVDHM